MKEGESREVWEEGSGGRSESDGLSSDHTDSYKRGFS